MSDNNNNLDNSEKEVYDSDNPKHIAKKSTESGRRDARIWSAYITLMSRPEGKELLKEILGWCLVGQEPFDSQTNYMYERCGAINIGQKIQAQMLKADPEKFSKIMMEFLNV